ncbi:MAG: aspartate aminotransferase family protein, partial [Thermodesulfobacteriota bacterium]|nr:aspartate aminotransferase family protein [Thermodesulfobacteriota bacterium]
MSVYKKYIPASAIDYAYLKDTYACPCDESKMYDKFLMPVKAKGMWVWFDGEEEPYLDLVLNYSSVNFGHCYQPIVEITKKVIERVDQIHSFHSKDKLELSEYLTKKISIDKSYKVYFNIGGSAAVSDAIRLCRYSTGKRYIISFDGSFHGVSHTAASVADDRLVAKEQFGIPVSDYTFSVPFPSKHNDIKVAYCLDKIEKLILDNDVAGIIIEPIQGAGGFIIPKDSFLLELSKLCKRCEVKLIIDEIQVGFGRAGSFFVHQQYGLTNPDIVLLSKSIAGGYFPVSAVIARSNLFDNVPVRGTAFQTTFNNSSFGLAIANRLMKLVDKENILDSVPEKGNILLKKLNFLGKSPYVVNLRGVGLAIAFDIVDPVSKLPSDKLAKIFVSQCLKEHVIIYACGVNFNSIKIIPSLVVTNEEIDIIVERLGKCLQRFHD